MTVARRPSGTLATMMPMRKMMESRTWYFMDTAMMKNITPTEMATPATMWTKCSISTAMGVFSLPTPDASEAIWPMTVWSPVLMTRPVAVPASGAGA